MNYFNLLYTDAIHQIALKVAIKDLFNLCLTNKRLSQICGDQRFWMSRTVQDFGITDKPVNMTWKEFYRRASVSDVDQLLFDSAKQGISELVMVAVTRGANLETVRTIAWNYYKPLIIASENGHLEVVKYLVQKGANIHALDNQAALRIASENGHLEVVKYLVQRGANIHAEDDFALRWASENGHLEVVRYLVQQGANIHAYNDEALRWASENGHLEVVKYLVRQGANIHALKDKALIWASANGYLEVVKYLRSLV